MDLYMGFFGTGSPPQTAFAVKIFHDGGGSPITVFETLTPTDSDAFPHSSIGVRPFGNKSVKLKANTTLGFPHMGGTNQQGTRYGVAQRECKRHRDSALKGFAHFSVSQRRRHFVGDGSALGLLVGGNPIRGTPTPASRQHIFRPYAKLRIHP